MATSPQAAKTIDLAQEMSCVLQEDHTETGRLTRPLINLPGLRVVLVSMRAGSKWNEHSTSGRITVQPLSGRIHMRYSGGELELNPGRLAAFAANVPHDVSALVDSVFLLTVARPAKD